MSTRQIPGSGAPKAPFGLDRRSILVGTGLAAAGALSHFAAPKAVAKPIEKPTFSSAIPDRVGGWTSRKTQEIVLPPQDDSNKLYENQETRVYEGADLPAIMFLIAYSSIQQNDVQVHRPEVCYPASGYPVIATEATQISYRGRELAARELVADRGGLHERVIYWIRVGNSFPTSWREQRINIAFANLSGSIPDGVLLRVSAVEEPGKSTSALLRTFIAGFLDQVPSSFRQSVLL
jgi:EpsI family protein